MFKFDLIEVSLPLWQCPQLSTPLTNDWWHFEESRWWIEEVLFSADTIHTWLPSLSQLFSLPNETKFPFRFTWVCKTFPSSGIFTIMVEAINFPSLRAVKTLRLFFEDYSFHFGSRLQDEAGWIKNCFMLETILKPFMRWQKHLYTNVNYALSSY